MAGRSSKSIKWHLAPGAKKAAAKPDKVAKDREWAEEFAKKVAAAVAAKKRAASK